MRRREAVDEFTRECLAIEVARKQSSRDVLRTLAGLMLRHGIPKHTRSDNGPEFVAKAVRDSFHRAGQSLGERLRRELQREAQGRTPQRRNLYNAARGKSVDGSLAPRVQSGPSTQFVGLQTTCARNDLRTVPNNSILTLDMDT